ncbi:MAG: epoxyqueuosine reductase QueH [Candidatus Thiodiazotropha endolucinida]
MTASLGISHWKNMQQINDCGHRAAANYPDLMYWDYHWRKCGGSQRMIEISKGDASQMNNHFVLLKRNLQIDD